MKRFTLLFVLIVGVLVIDRPAPAVDFGLGLFNKRKTKVDPPSRAKVLLDTLKSDPDESKRKTAATELRGLDPRNTPDLIPGLVNSLQKDPSPAVRIEAAESISVLKPISQPAGLAMEAALTSDPDPKVRETLKSALWQYHLNGYRTPPSGSTLATQTTEPPIAAKSTNTVTAAKPTMPKSGEPSFRPITNVVGKGIVVQSSPEPPIAKPKPSPTAPPRGPGLLPQPTPPAKPELKLPAPNNTAPKQMPSVKPEPVPAPSIPTPAVPSTVPSVGVPTVPTVPSTLPAPTPNTPSVSIPTVGIPPSQPQANPELPSSVPLPSIPVIPIPSIPVPPATTPSGSPPPVATSPVSTPLTQQTNPPTVPAAKNF